MPQIGWALDSNSFQRFGKNGFATLEEACWAGVNAARHIGRAISVFRVDDSGHTHYGYVHPDGTLTLGPNELADPDMTEHPHKSGQKFRPDGIVTLACTTGDARPGATNFEDLRRHVTAELDWAASVLARRGAAAAAAIDGVASAAAAAADDGQEYMPSALMSFQFAVNRALSLNVRVPAVWAQRAPQMLQDARSLLNGIQSHIRTLGRSGDSAEQNRIQTLLWMLHEVLSTLDAELRIPASSKPVDTEKAD